MKQVGGTLPTFYHACVEDRADPLMLGRVRVRVVGVHSENVADIPTEDLPWAPIALSATNPGTSGLGWSPTGLVPGSWVIVYFADGESLQQPVVIGTTVGLNPLQKPEGQAGGTASSFKPTQSKTSSESLAKSLTEWVPGYITKRREAGVNGGAWTIAKDKNGYSYGSIQLNQSQMGKYLAQSKFKNEFSGMTPGTPEFNAKWESLGKAHPAEFAAEQEEYSKSSNYTPAIRSLKGYGLESRSPAVQEAIYSTSNQYGYPKGSKLCKEALNGRDLSKMSDADVIRCIYDYKRNTVDSSFKSALANGTASRKGLIDGWNTEEALLLKECPDDLTEASLQKTTPLESNAYGDTLPTDPVLSETDLSPLKIAFGDPSGKYPTNGYLGDPDTNRLARNQKIQKTVVALKKQQRIISSQYTEPETNYNAKYPYNKVYQSESGHIIELDDSPNHERIHVYHKSGTFLEIHPDGTVVQKSVGSDHEVVLKDKQMYVVGNVTINVEGNATINSQGNIDLKAEHNINMASNGNIKITSGGDVDITAAGIFRYAAGKRVEKIRKRIWYTEVDETKIIKKPNLNIIPVEVGNKVNILTGKLSDDIVDGDDAFNESSNVVNSKKELNDRAGFDVGSDGEITKPTVKDIEKQSPGTVLELPSTFDAGTRLSEHFTLADLTTDVTAFKYALREQAGLSEEEIVKNLQGVAVNILEPLVAHFGRDAFVITNAFRHSKSTDKYKSDHVIGCAVDLQFTGYFGDPHVHIAEEIRRLLPDYHKIILEWHSPNGVIHVAYKSSGNAQKAFTTYTTNFAVFGGGAFYDSRQNLVYA